MESTNISVRNEKVWKFNLTLIMSVLGLAVCVLGISNVFTTVSLQTPEYFVNAALLIVLALAFLALAIISGFRKFKNTSKIGFVYVVLFILIVYLTTRVIWTGVAFNGRVEAILSDYTNYTTDVTRQYAADLVIRNSQSIIIFGIIALIGMGSLVYFSTMKTLDGESRWPYLLAFGLTLLAFYLVAYNEINFLNNTSNLDTNFWALFGESRAPVFSLIFIFVVNLTNDYDPDQDRQLAKIALAK